MSSLSAETTTVGEADKVLAADRLSDLAASLTGRGITVIIPARDGKVIRLTSWRAGLEIDLDGMAVNSAKEFLLPRSEIIERYSLSGDDFTPIDVQVEARPTVLLCIRPCDAASLDLLDTVFNWDYKDKFYDARRAACTVVSLACTAADSACFCTSVRLGPGSTVGADVVCLRADGGKKLIFHPLTDKGRALVSAAPDLLKGGPAVADPLAQVPVRFDSQLVADWLADIKNFDSPLWKDLSLACLSCGACAFACPSCHCFDIQDEASGSRSVRRRNWDTCGLALFTQHTGGHNPRPEPANRWRQRVMHKFSYILQRFARLGCTGCGRCSRLCPNGMAIVEVCERIERECKK